jgi:hypothetical protein
MVSELTHTDFRSTLSRSSAQKRYLSVERCKPSEGNLAMRVAVKVSLAGAAIFLMASVAAQEKSLAQKCLDGEAKLATPFNHDGGPVTIRYSTFPGKAGTAPALLEKLVIA